MRHAIVALTGLSIAAALGGCTVGPDYERPGVAFDPRFANASDALDSAIEVEADYWSGFDDPLLDRLMREGIEANHDIRIAEANLREARALLLEARYDLYPIVPLSAGYTRQLQSEAERPGVSRSLREGDLFFAGLDATWELDFFGRVRRTIEAREADVQSFEASRRDVMVSVLAEIARNYFELRGAQNRLHVAQENAANQKQTYDLTVSLLEGGRGTEFDTSRALAQYQTTLSLIPPLEARVLAAAYRIAVLAGRPHTALVDELTPVREAPALPDVIAIGDPAALLRRRPDIQVVERSLAAATARVGVATADLFPRVTLNGSVGLAADTLGGLFESGAERYSIGPAITWAAFDLGRVRAQVRAADARVEGVLAQYEVTVLEALEETDAALVSFRTERERLAHIAEAEAASRKAARLAQRRYQDGVDTFLTVLDAEARLLEVQDLLAEAQTRAATALIAVYKALGGGWEVGGARETLPSDRDMDGASGENAATP